MQTIVTIIVTYNPEFPLVENAVKRLLDSTDHIIIVDNASESIIRDKLQSYSSKLEKVYFLEQRENTGIGAAFNTGIKKALDLQATHLLLLDHDSIPAEGMVQKLTTAINELQQSGKVAAVGPKIINQYTGNALSFVKIKYGLIYKSRDKIITGEASSGENLRNVESKSSPYIEVDHLISSGTIIPVSIINEVGMFEESFFIDGVDTEWCFRAKNKGYRLFGVDDAELFHHLGENSSGIGKKVKFHQHSPLRHYYKIRNAFLLCRKPHVPFLFKLLEIIRNLIKIIIYPFLVDSERLRHLRFLLLGLYHGIIGKTGPL